MAKKKSKSKVVQVPVEEARSHGPIRAGKAGCVCISIYAKPSANISAITCIDSENVGVRIGASPKDGEANAELLGYMAKVLGVRKSDMNLERGSRGKDKLISVQGITVAHAQARLLEALES